jgi:hypothetical protein
VSGFVWGGVCVCGGLGVGIVLVWWCGFVLGFCSLGIWGIGCVMVLCIVVEWLVVWYDVILWVE